MDKADGLWLLPMNGRSALTEFSLTNVFFIHQRAKTMKNSLIQPASYPEIPANCFIAKQSVPVYFK